jgi:hypothetical protein
MNRFVGAVRFAGAELDFATWHAHLAGTPAAGRAIFQQPRREVEPAAQVDRRWVPNPIETAAMVERAFAAVCCLGRRP